MTDVAYYRQILKDQTELLDSNIEKYLKILDKELDRLPESVVGQIRLVIGQSRLFINERFKQFSGLVDDCELKRGEKEIKVEDLAGFWDMINYQIDDLKSKYAELEQLQSNDWQPIDEKKPVVKKITKNQTPTIRKPLQTVINNGGANDGGNRTTTTTTNGFANKSNKMNGHNNHHHNGKDSIDGGSSNAQVMKKAPIKSNFREFLKAKKQEKLNTKTMNSNDNKLNNENGHHENNATTSKNHNDEDIQIMILVNHNNNNNNHHDHDDEDDVKKNGHVTNNVKSDDDDNNDECSTTTTTENNIVINGDDNGNDNTKSDESNESSSSESKENRNSIQVSVN